MRRTLVLVLAAGLAAVPAVGLAARPAPSLTLLSPAADSVSGGVVSVRWSYVGFHRTTPVDIEARRGEEPFTRLARVPIDDGSPGSYGSMSWSTGPDDDGADWTVRVIAPTNKSVSSSVAPVAIDNTGPTTTIAGTETPVSVLVDITGSSADALSTVASVLVEIAGADGSTTERAASCDCTTSTASWTVSTAGLAPASYEVRAWGVDALGNVGAPATATLLIVGAPTVTVPEVTVPEPTVPEPTVPEPTVAEPTVPDGTVPDDPASTVPSATVAVAVPTL